MRKALTLSAFVVVFVAAVAAAVGFTIIQSRAEKPIEASVQALASS
ncbi:MAG: hypothetical protein JNL61_03550 [Rhizobiaceae bacterium]|nr:hypothetical protein [Rhizobiaceae bacterium]